MFLSTLCTLISAGNRFELVISLRFQRSNRFFHWLRCYCVRFTKPCGTSILNQNADSRLCECVFSVFFKIIVTFR